MAKTIDQLLREADDIIDRHEKVASAQRSCRDEEDDIEKMAAMLLSSADARKDAEQFDASSVCLTEKIAHAVAIVETLMNADKLAQLAEFEKKASDAGYGEAEISEYLEKAAAAMDYKKLWPLIPIAAAGLTGGAIGGYVGHKKGKSSGEKEGYGKALKDVDKAMQEYQL